MKKPVTSQKNVYSKTTIQQEHKINTAPQDEILAAFIA